MIQGTFAEFRNRFVNPITNGQASDSTDRDVRIMKKRSFILNDLLKGCLQRLDYNVLVPYLQPKFEYVLCICLTDFQKKLYAHYLENFARAGQIGMDGKLEGGKKGGLFYDVQNLSRVWNHPCILLKAKVIIVNLLVLIVIKWTIIRYCRIAIAIIIIVITGTFAMKI